MRKKKNDITSFLTKKIFTIKDVARITRKHSKTVRSWELKGIIKRPERYSDDKYEWREYSKTEMADTLEAIANYPWKRKVIKNIDELNYMVKYLRGEVDEKIFLTVMEISLLNYF